MVQFAAEIGSDLLTYGVAKVGDGLDAVGHQINRRIVAPLIVVAVTVIDGIVVQPTFVILDGIGKFNKMFSVEE
jgi:hypothetical protein